MSLTMRNDQLVKKRFDTLRSEAYEKYADDPVMAKQVAGTLSTTALTLAGIWAEFYDEFNYDSPWIMSTMGKVTPFIKAFSNERLMNVALEDLPNTVVTLFVVPENNRIEIIIGKTSVVTIKVVDSNIHVSFAKEKQFELSEFVKEHVNAALVKLDRLTQLTEDIVNDMINGQEEDESDE
jgi:hypothetical protein